MGEIALVRNTYGYKTLIDSGLIGSLMHIGRAIQDPQMRAWLSLSI